MANGYLNHAILFMREAKGDEITALTLRAWASFLWAEVERKEAEA